MCIVYECILYVHCICMHRGSIFLRFSFLHVPFRMRGSLRQLYLGVLWCAVMRIDLLWCLDLEVSKNRGTPKSSIWIGFSTINHPFWGAHPYFWKHPFMSPSFPFLHFQFSPGSTPVNHGFRMFWTLSQAQAFFSCKTAHPNSIFKLRSLLARPFLDPWRLLPFLHHEVMGVSSNACRCATCHRWWWGMWVRLRVVGATFSKIGGIDTWFTRQPWDVFRCFWIGTPIMFSFWKKQGPWTCWWLWNLRKGKQPQSYKSSTGFLLSKKWYLIAYHRNGCSMPGNCPKGLLLGPLPVEWQATGTHQRWVPWWPMDSFVRR